MLMRLIVIGVFTFGDRIITASDLFSFKTSRYHIAMFSLHVRKPPFARKLACVPMVETLRIIGCRRHTGDVAC